MSYTKRGLRDRGDRNQGKHESEVDRRERAYLIASFEHPIVGLVPSRPDFLIRPNVQREQRLNLILQMSLQNLAELVDDLSELVTVVLLHCGFLTELQQRGQTGLELVMLVDVLFHDVLFAEKFLQ